MTIERMDNIGIIVDDLAAAIAFFRELGLELDGQQPVEGRWVDRRHPHRAGPAAQVKRFVLYVPFVAKNENRFLMKLADCGASRLEL